MSKKNILVAQSERAIAQNVKAMLEGMGYTVPRIIMTGEDALRIAAEIRPALVLMDIHLPGKIDGLTAAKRITAELKIPVVYLATSLEEDKSQRAPKSPSHEIALSNVLRGVSDCVETGTGLGQREAPRQQLGNQISRKTALLGIASCDAEGNILKVNPALLKILGSPSEKETRKVNVFTFPALINSGIAAQVKLCFQTGKHITYETEYTSKWGKASYLRVHISPAEYKGNRVSVIQIIAEDFSEYKKAVDALQASEANFRKVYDQAGDTIFILGLDGRILDANQTACQKLGYSATEIKTLRLKDISVGPIEDIPATIKRIKTGRSYIAETRLRGKDEHEFPVEISSSLILYNGEKILMSVARDITQRKLAEENAEQHRAELRTLMDVGRQVTETSSFKDTLQTILDNAVQHLGADAGSIIITSPLMHETILYDGLTEDIVADLKLVCPLVTKVKWHQCIMQKEHTFQIIDNQGEFPHCAPLSNADFQTLLNTPLWDQDMLLGYLHLFRRDVKRFSKAEIQFLETLIQQSITAIKKAHLFEETQRLAVTDALTQLYNRRYLYTLGKRELERAQRYQTHFSALMIDADHFKKINDNYGHAAGDQVLQELAHHLRKSTREVDVLGRYGGEEFAILLPNTTLEAATELANRLRKRINQEITLTRLNNHPTLTISIGVATLGADTPTLEALLDKADAALYEAKKAGRNTVVAKK